MFLRRKWKGIYGPLLIVFIISSGFFTYLSRISSPPILGAKPKSSLNAYLNLSLIVDALLYNYGAGRFTESNVPTTRAFNDGLSILWMIQEFYHIDIQYTLSASIPVQGPAGGFFYDLSAPLEFSYPVYYVLHAYQILNQDWDGILNEQKCLEFFSLCYNGTTGGFALKPGDPSNINANWMIVHAIKNLGAPLNFDAEKNIGYCVDSFEIGDAQKVFSCLDSTFAFGKNLSLFYDVPAIISQCETIFLHSTDFNDRFYGLLTLDLLGRPAPNYNSSILLTQCISSLMGELEGIKNLHNIFTQLDTIALLLGEMTANGFFI